MYLTQQNCILQDLKRPLRTPIPLWIDNNSTMHIIENPVFHERTKHIELDCHLIRDSYKDGCILPSYVLTKSQLVDVFTKSLPAAVLSTLLFKMGFTPTARP
ncbi:hypothetical protein LIER_21833 [Lithospermum erythrorhizon]|uniref:Copia protein n=1 Tax=Lithospermum erythrorhizon TaxID=34254 RepID=A0AAV3QRL4_LITER